MYSAMFSKTKHPYVVLAAAGGVGSASTGGSMSRVSLLASLENVNVQEENMPKFFLTNNKKLPLVSLLGDDCYGSRN